MKYFVTSDVHSFLDPLRTALKEKGFDSSNNEHCLIVCGDLFDRGDQSYELLTFVMSLPNRILIRGNHEDLLEECCNRGFPLTDDKSNGTTKTIQDISKVYSAYNFSKACQITYDKTAAYRAELVNYFETKNYIFVHGWIPCEKITGEESKTWWQMNKSYEYNPYWRNCNDVEWESARWTNGMARAHEGIIEPGKTIVCGHWHCSYGHKYAGHCSNEFEYAMWEPYYGEGVIGIDRCTAYTGKVNVLVLEDVPVDS